MLRRSWETKKKIIKELNNRLNENRIISEAKGYKYSNNWGNLDPVNNKIDDFLSDRTSEEFVNSFSKKVLDIYYNIMKSSCGFGTTTTRFLKNFKSIDSLEELKELNGAIEEKPICGGSYKSLEDVLNGEFTGGAITFGGDDIDYLREMSKHLEEKGIGSIKYTSLVNPGQTDPYGVKDDSIQIIIGSKEEPETEEKEETETEEKTEKKKSFTGVSDVKTLEDIVSNKKIIKKGNSGDIVKLIQQSLLDLKYDIIGTADGKFGPKTKEGVQKFQKDNELTDDGIVGPKTAQKMIDIMNLTKEKNKVKGGVEFIEKVKTTLKDENLSPEQKQDKIEKDLKNAGVNINLDTNIDFSNLTKLKEPKEIEKEVDLVFNKLGIQPVGEFDRNLQSESEISKPILEMMKRMNILK